MSNLSPDLCGGSSSENSGGKEGELHADEAGQMDGGKREANELKRRFLWQPFSH